MKVCPVVAELFRADGRRGITNLIVAFRNFAKAPEKKLDLPRPDFRIQDTHHTKSRTVSLMAALW